MAPAVTVRLLSMREGDEAFSVDTAMKRETLLSGYLWKGSGDEAGRTETWVGSKGLPESSTP